MFAVIIFLDNHCDMGRLALCFTYLNVFDLRMLISTQTFFMESLHLNVTVDVNDRLGSSTIKTLVKSL